MKRPAAAPLQSPPKKKKRQECKTPECKTPAQSERRFLGYCKRCAKIYCKKCCRKQKRKQKVVVTRKKNESLVSKTFPGTKCINNERKHQPCMNGAAQQAQYERYCVACFAGKYPNRMCKNPQCPKLKQKECKFGGYCKPCFRAKVDNGKKRLCITFQCHNYHKTPQSHNPHNYRGYYEYGKCRKCYFRSVLVSKPTQEPKAFGSISREQGIVLNYTAHMGHRGNPVNSNGNVDSCVVTVRYETQVRTYTAEEFAALVSEPVEKIKNEINDAAKQGCRLKYCSACKHPGNNKFAIRQRAQRLETFERAERARSVAKP